ncbi:MAG: nucleotide sugar dehydrogenase [Pseudomonadota bacterium]
MSNVLKSKIESKTARIGIVGLGYVGLPLAVDFAKAGYTVTGFDVLEDRVARLNRQDSYVEDIPSSDLLAVKGKFSATTDFSKLAQMDCVSICVPTPLSKTRDPDVSYILAVRNELAKTIHSDMLVILESTTYPGTTDEIFVPLVEEKGFELGKNFFLSFSPERIDPGNKKYFLRNTPKVVGGITAACTEMSVLLYSKIVEKLVPVSSARAAELVKILENTFRAVNIGLVNEVAIMCRVLGLDTWEVIDAAATKPFGYTAFYPGPGLGGHCIPIDPLYLSWKLREMNYNARFIELAAEINASMPHHVVNLVSDALNKAKKSVNGAKILLLGMAYKPDISDLRESPALDIFHLLEEKGAEVSFNDPHVETLKLEGKTVQSVPATSQTLGQYDLVVITTHHSAYHPQQIVEGARAIVDTRNLLKGIRSPKIIRL